MVLDALPAALGMDKDAVETAVRDTAEIIAEAERRAAAEREATWRLSFMPDTNVRSDWPCNHFIETYLHLLNNQFPLRFECDLGQQPGPHVV